MLSLLKIKNVALIDELDISFDAGLNVLSGETGAGKSIIIDALNFVLGAKLNKNLLKSGREQMSVKALFVGPFNKNIIDQAASFDIEVEEDILISREYNINGKTEIKCNGVLLTSIMLRAITSLLIDIHGQHEHQSLLKEREHIKILDEFKIIPITKIKDEMQAFIDEYKEIIAKIEALGTDEYTRKRTLDLLEYQIKEINDFSVKEGEIEELKIKKEAYANAERITQKTSSAYGYLENDYEGVASAIKKAETELRAVAKFNSEFDSYAERLQSARLEIIDITESIASFNKEFGFDETEFNFIDKRLDSYKLLQKKYGANEKEILEYLDKIQKDYDDLLSGEKLLNKLNIKKEEVQKKIYLLAKKLSDLRHEAADELKNKVNVAIKELAMKNANFEVEFTANLDKDIVTTDGFDRVRFMFSANIGQPLKPLSDIISGGEMSRLMLALKSIIADKDKITTVVFDEIDTGISGAVGFEIACKMAKISKSHQVLAVTHLPQICAMANERFLIIKTSSKMDTKTGTKKLNLQESIFEIARLSGGDGNEESLKHAEKLMEKCNAFKNTL